ncbi:MAG: AraC family transcriptional regulator [Kiloniellales bacterium]|nr:AraC family transcriptional regulator [Kiloniellales bacterium]
MFSDQETAYRESGGKSGDYVCFWREDLFEDMECLSASFENHRYVPHIHETYAIGVILSGEEAFRYRGVENIAGTGQIVSVNPFELHDGRPVKDRFGYRMIYPSLSLVGDVASDIAEKPSNAPMIRDAVIDDLPLARLFVRLHQVMEEAAAPRLTVEAIMAEALGRLLLHYGDFSRQARSLGRERGPISRVRSYIDENFAADISLEALSHVAALSRFHLLRAFRKETGATPHAYLLSRRIAAAKKALPGERSLAEIALDCGFFDQSHFTRTFKAWTGVTPSAYRKGSKILQDAA